MSGLANKFYDLAIAEGEGLGTAYEYLAKYRLFDKIIPKEKKLKVLISGLPEIYGYSLDFVFFCREYNLDYEIIDERADRIDRIKQICRKINNIKIPAQHRNLCDLDSIYPEKGFDWVFSCEVFQRFSRKDRSRHIISLKKIAKNAVLFIPNGDNEAHNTHSGLSAIKLRELIGQFDSIYNYRIKDVGYVDMPPWPPGAKKNIFRSETNGKKRNILLNILRIAAFIEPVYPLFIKSRYAHLIYIVI